MAADLRARSAVGCNRLVGGATPRNQLPIYQGFLKK